MTSAERRRFSRSKLQFDERILVEVVDQGGTASSAWLLDISEGGAALEVGGSYPIGSQLSVSVQLPGTRSPINCWAQVRRVLPGRGVMLEFQDLPPFQTDCIRAFLNSRRSGQS